MRHERGCTVCHENHSEWGRDAKMALEHRCMPEPRAEVHLLCCCCLLIIITRSFIKKKKKKPNWMSTFILFVIGYQ